MHKNLVWLGLREFLHNLKTVSIVIVAYILLHWAKFCSLRAARTRVLRLEKDRLHVKKIFLQHKVGYMPLSLSQWGVVSCTRFTLSITSQSSRVWYFYLIMFFILLGGNWFKERPERDQKLLELQKPSVPAIPPKKPRPPKTNSLNRPGTLPPRRPERPIVPMTHTRYCFFQHFLAGVMTICVKKFFHSYGAVFYIVTALIPFEVLSIRGIATLNQEPGVGE